MKKQYLSLAALVLFVTPSPAQSLLNKLKNKANQEVNKLENGTGSSSQSQGQPNKNNKLSANVTRTVVLSMAADEVFDYQENCISLGSNTSDIAFIVARRSSNNSVQCYSYVNGSKTPVACPSSSNSNNCQTSSLQCSYSKLREIHQSSDEIKKYTSNQTETHAMQTPAITDDQLKQMSAYMTPAQMDDVKKKLAEASKQTEGKTLTSVLSTTINFNGKQYGPYKQLLQFFLTPDGKNFYAIASTTEGQYNEKVKYSVITSASDKTLSTYAVAPTSILAAPDNSEFGMYHTPDYKTYQISTSGGKTLSITETSWFQGAWYLGSRIVYQSHNKVYVDGQVVKTFPENETHDPCNLYLSLDGKNMTEVKDQKIYFADGDYFEYPLKIESVNSVGRQYFKWLALEGNQLVVYQKPQ